MNETGRTIQTIVSAILGVIFIALMGVFTSVEASWAMLLGALAFFAMFGVNLWTVALSAYDAHIMTATEYAEKFSRLDDESRAALGWLFPKMRYVMKRGIVRQEFEDTGVSVDLFRIFLQTSNSKYISPKRDWQSAAKPEAAWLAIYQWLQERDYIIPDSASGSISWLWKGNAYNHLMAYWMAGRAVANMNSEQVYATEVDMPELYPPPPPEEDAYRGSN